MDKLTKPQFDKLPQDQVVQYKGRQLTKGQFISLKKREHDTAIAALKKKQAAAASRFQSRRAKFLSNQKARVGAANAKVMAEFERLRKASGPTVSPQQQEAVSKEVDELIERAKTASPAEREQIDRRAQALLARVRPPADR